MWDLYLMNSNSGEPRQITNDSSGWMQDVDLSPDGSQVVYDRADKGFTRPEIAIVSSLGGTGKRIVSIGINPRWRPDGKRIAYLQTPEWGSRSGMMEIRSITPNGTDDRLEVADTSGSAFNYAWSPDGNMMAFSRRVPGGHVEIFSRDLASGKERQLTSFKKGIGALCWMSQDEIVFSGDLNGNTNIWMIPAAGGTPVQITRGSGPDVAPALSADLKRFLYVQQQSIGHLWLASLKEGTSRQLTFDDAQLSAPAFSSDGKRIAYVVVDPHPSGTTSSVVLLDRDGGGKTVLLTGDGNVHEPLWSSSGRWIAYAAHADTIPHDSSRTYLIEVDNPDTPREIGRGIPSKWLDERTVLTQNASGTWACSVDGAPPKRYFRDSTYATPVLGGAYILYTDVVPSRRAGVWIEPSSGLGRSTSGARQLIKSLSSYQIDPAGAYVYYISPQNALHRVAIPDGKDEPVRGAFPNLRRGAAFSLGPDGTSVVFLDSRTTGKLVMIDDFH
jgi:Tol biopolymer transport system component